MVAKEDWLGVKKAVERIGANMAFRAERTKTALEAVVLEGRRQRKALMEENLTVVMLTGDAIWFLREPPKTVSKEERMVVAGMSNCMVHQRMFPVLVVTSAGI